MVAAPAKLTSYSGRVIAEQKNSEDGARAVPHPNADAFRVQAGTRWFSYPPNLRNILALSVGVTTFLLLYGVLIFNKIEKTIVDTV